MARRSRLFRRGNIQSNGFLFRVRNPLHAKVSFARTLSKSLAQLLVERILTKYFRTVMGNSRLSVYEFQTCDGHQVTNFRIVMGNSRLLVHEFKNCEVPNFGSSPDPWRFTPLYNLMSSATFALSRDQSGSEEQGRGCIVPFLCIPGSFCFFRVENKSIWNFSNRFEIDVIV